MNQDHLRYFQSLEQQQLDLCLESGFGYYLLVMGEANVRRVVLSPVHDHFALVDPCMARGGDARVHWTQLPLAAHSIDTVVLLHALERTADAAAVLAEVQRILHPAGRLIVMAFDPFRMVTHAWARALWGEGKVTQLHTAFELKTLLARQGFAVESLHPYGYHVSAQVHINRLSERIGRRLLPALALGYTIVARPNVRCLTPVKPSWASNPLPIRMPVPEVRTQGVKRNSDDGRCENS